MEAPRSFKPCLDLWLPVTGVVIELGNGTPLTGSFQPADESPVGAAPPTARAVIRSSLTN